MFEIAIKSEGMMCGHCEAHMNEAIEGAFEVKRVTSDHEAGITTILSETDIPDAELERVVATTNYQFLGATHSEKAASGLFGFMK